MQDDIQACEDQQVEADADIEEQEANIEDAESAYEEDQAEAQRQYEENEAEVEAEAEDLLSQLAAVSPLDTADAISPDPLDGIVATLLAALGLEAALSYVTAQMAAAAGAAAAEAYAIWQKVKGLLNGTGAPTEDPIFPKGLPRPSPNFEPPTNLPQSPPIDIPDGWRVREMPPTDQYPDGYWKLEKPLPGGYWQPIDPSTMKPGNRPQTHVPFPPKGE